MTLREGAWWMGAVETHMSIPRISLKGQTINGRLMAWFLAISLIPCGILATLATWLSARAIEDSVRRDLMVISDAKADELETFARERLHWVTWVARTPSMVQAVTRLDEAYRKGGADSPESRLARDELRPPLANVAESFAYPNLLLFSPRGEVLFRLHPDLDPGEKIQEGPLKDSGLAASVDQAGRLLKAEISTYQFYPGMSEPASFVASPMLDAAGKVVGVAAFRLDNAQIFRVFTDYTGLGETGETLVGVRKGDEVTLVAPLRHDRMAAFRRKITMGGRLSVNLQAAVQGQTGYGVALDYRGEKVAASHTYLPTFRWGMVVKQDADEAFYPIYRQRLAVGGLLIAVLLPVVWVARLVARSISRPVRDAAQVAERVASGDLTARVETHASGEIGRLLLAIETMTEFLRSLIGRIQKSSVSLMSTATEIAATSRQQEQTVNDYGASTHEAAAAVQEISATSQELLKTMDDVSEVAEQTAAMASEGQESLAGMDRTMRLLAESTGSIGSKLAVISERAGNINLVVTTITKVADQTNLLSINAAIEAEKAGEYGLGFLVVAREIRRLADQTAVATLDIERMVKEMQYSVSAGVMEMDKFSDQVRQGVGEVSHISEQLGRIIAAVQAVTSRFDQVNEGMRAQSQGADQIREAMVRLNEGARQTSLSLKEFNKAKDHLREAVSGLKEEVSGFILGAPGGGGGPASR